MAENHLKQLAKLGAIELRPDSFTTYATTDLGRAWVKALYQMPPPRKVFLDALGQEITP